MSSHPGSMPSTQQQAGAPQDPAEQHEQDIESKEAYQYWGYLFKPDKTGTDRLKGLLRGLKEVINEHYEPSDQPDLTPAQLASFYRELHGNYDQLFLGTPSESIAFIYKSLGCLHSLQPLSQSTAFTDPTVPALKTEGWIMWQTIQLLLGPDEHSSFLMEAVQKWDVKDPATGELYPKILPRQCFPLEPDKHMVAWYEGVSDRLRREAEEEERQREIEAQQVETRRINARREGSDDEGSVNSREPAIAYFANPMYRRDGDGRPGIVRRSSKRPQLSPRPTMMGKGKEAATSMGHVIRNIGSPHLWDGRGHPSKSHSRDRVDSHRRRRTSLPDDKYRAGEEPPSSSARDSALSPGQARQPRRRSQQVDQPQIDPAEEELYAGGTPVNSPRPGSHHHSRQRYSEDRDATLRHSRSHEPTPSQKEYGDYFQGFDDPSRRNSSTYESNSPAPTPNGVGPMFGPSASPLFASHIAKQPQPPRPPPGDQYGGPPRMAPPFRRAQDRPYSHSRSPDPSSRRREDRDSRRFSSHDRRSRFDQSPERPPYDDYGPSPPPPQSQPGFPPLSGGPPNPPSDEGSRRGSGVSSMPPPPSSGGGYPPSSRDRDRDRDRRSGRVSESDVSYSGTEERHGHGHGDRERERERDAPSRRKQTRFADGVHGRKYPS